MDRPQYGSQQKLVMILIMILLCLQQFQFYSLRNGQFVSVLFIILIVVDIHGHRFEIYTLVSEFMKM